MAFGNVYRNFWHILRADGFVFRGRRKFGILVVNKSGSTIATDKLVAISGYDTGTKLPKIVLADADSANLATEVWVTNKAIVNNKTATVFKGGVSAATVDTSGVTNAGDPVYLSTTAGAFTATAPTDPAARVVIVGYAHVKSSTVGQIQWDIQDASKVSALDLSVVTGRALAQAAAVASVCTVTPAVDTSYDVCMNVLVTTATTHTFTGQCTYTDEGNTARTVTMPFRLVGDTTAVTSSIVNTNGAVPYSGVAVRIRAKAGTAVTLLTQAGGTYTTVVFNVEGSIRQVA
jgi:hypothetical protein